MSKYVQQSFELNQNRSLMEEAIARIEKENYVARLWQKDGTLWKRETEHQKIIANSLGWLTVAEAMLDKISDLTDFTSEIRQAGFQHVMLLGMGGSSLCPEVFRRTFGKVANYPELLVLDTTDPATIRSLESRIDLGKTLFIVASKSGTTTEPLMFYEYFFDRVSSVKKNSAGENFVAITDPASLLEKIAAEKSFRRTFLNWADIGGRYSALSYFGIVPAALMGLNITEMLKQAIQIARKCRPENPIRENPGAVLGALLGTFAKAGRDKVTFVIPPPLDSLGLWTEQLIAESTGKEGRGILPVAGEALGTPEVYGNDRLFVFLSLEGADDAKYEKDLKALQNAGHPLVRHVLQDKLTLGAEFFLWEIATAIAGAMIEINAFDQPNVQESKDNTRAFLSRYQKEGKLPEQPLLFAGDGIRIFADEDNIAELKAHNTSLQSCIQAHLQRLKPRDYFAITAYIQETPQHEELLEKIRMKVRNQRKVATTVGYGPRFLHSTGQLHKGGPENGVFIQITADDVPDLRIPGEPQTFGVLKHAQALGDFQSLSSRRRRAIRFDCGTNIAQALTKLLEAM